MSLLSLPPAAMLQLLPLLGRRLHGCLQCLQGCVGEHAGGVHGTAPHRVQQHLHAWQHQAVGWLVGLFIAWLHGWVGGWVGALHGAMHGRWTWDEKHQSMHQHGMLLDQSAAVCVYVGTG